MQVYEKLADLQYWENVQSGRSVLKGPVGLLHEGDRFTFHSRYAPGPVDGLITESEKGQVRTTARSTHQRSSHAANSAYPSSQHT